MLMPIGHSEPFAFTRKESGNLLLFATDPDGNGQIASGASVKIISNEIKRWCKMNIQKISLFWLKKLRLAKTMKEKIRAMTALTAIEKHAPYISRILDQASQGLAK